MQVWPRFKRRYPASGAETSPAQARIFESDVKIELNSLTAIQTAAELLAVGGTSADLRQELVGIVSKECEHLSARIAGLVRRDRASSRPILHEADLKPIIDAAVQEAEFALFGRGIVVRNESAPDLPPIQCNPEQMRELLMSLALNAVQSLPGGDHVVLNARLGDDGVILQVRVRGQTSFVRRLAKRPFAARSVATDVGLAAAYDIVHQHGGRIEAKVNVRKGLEFLMWLPLHRGL